MTTAAEPRELLVTCRIMPSLGAVSAPGRELAEAATGVAQQLPPRGQMVELLAARGESYGRSIRRRTVGAHNELFFIWPWVLKQLHDSELLADGATVEFVDSFAQPASAAEFLRRPRCVPWAVAKLVRAGPGATYKVRTLRVALLGRGDGLPLPSVSYVTREARFGVPMARGYVLHPMSGQIFQSDRAAVSKRAVLEALERAAAARAQPVLFRDATPGGPVRVHGIAEVALTPLGAVSSLNADCIVIAAPALAMHNCLIEGMDNFVLIHEAVPFVDGARRGPAPRPVHPARRGGAAAPVAGSPIHDARSRSTTADDETPSSPPTVAEIVEHFAAKRARAAGVEPMGSLSYFSSIAALPGAPSRTTSDAASVASPGATPDAEEDPESSVDRYLIW